MHKLFRFRVPFSRAILLLCSFFLLSASRLHAIELLAEPTLLALLKTRTRPDAPSSEIVRVNQGGKTGIEKLEGASAHAYAQNLKARRRSAFDKADQALQARGFWKTDHVVVLRSVSLVGGKPIPRGDNAFVTDPFSNGVSLRQSCLTA